MDKKYVYEMVLHGGKTSSQFIFKHDYRGIEIVEFKPGFISRTILLQDQIIEDLKKMVKRQRPSLSILRKEIALGGDWRSHIIYDMFYEYDFDDYELIIREIYINGETRMRFSMSDVKQMNNYFKKIEESKK